MVSREVRGAIFATVVIMVVLYTARNLPLLQHDSPKESAPRFKKAGKELDTRKELNDQSDPQSRPQVGDPKSTLEGLKFLPYKPITITEAMTPRQVAGAFQALANQKQVLCPSGRLYGGKNGDWPVCKAKAYLPQKPCVIYSFGINFDWTFDEKYRKEHGCLVRSFDPSMAATPEHEHLPGIPFYPVGLSDKREIHAKKGWQMDNLKGFMTRFKENNKTIPYVKFDIETSEWRVLDNLLKDGSLKNVMQLGFEIHVDTAKNYRKYFKLIKGLESIGFRRWYGKQRGGGFLYQNDQSYININFLKNKQ